MSRSPPLSPQPPPRQSLPNSKHCSKCSKLTDKANPASTCSICSRKCHVTCTNGTFADHEVARLKQASSQFLYTCFSCYDKFSGGKIKNYITFAQEAQRKHATEVEKLRALYEQKLNENKQELEIKEKE